MFQFKLKYFIYTILLFAIEVFIAKYVHDAIIRPYIGDVLVVILLYCFIKSFAKISVNILALSVLLFAFLIEFLQYCNLVKLLGLQHNKTASIIIGNSFSWIDMGCYVVGILIVLVIEKIRAK